MVALAASAGGLDALKRFLGRAPEDGGMAYVVIQHLDPERPSLLPELLARVTQMPVEQVTEPMPLRPNHVYVIPPNRFLSVHDGTLVPIEPDKPRGQRMPADYFFTRLVDELGERAVGVVLSGMDGDGSHGLRAIRAGGGMTFAQSPEQAEFSSMPTKAVQTQRVDRVADAEQLPGAIAELIRSRDQLGVAVARDAPGPDQEALDQVIQQVIAILQEKTRHDFGAYKRPTLRRRVQRRMALNFIQDANEYVRLIRTDEHEADLLLQDLLISVTHFFRDPEVFRYLADECVGQMCERLEGDEPLRLWVPGVATGEEAYTLLMLLHEHFEKTRSRCRIQVFATDIDSRALQVARAGVYPLSIRADVSPERLEKYFVEEASGYRVRKSLREQVTFAEHNVLQDPPYSKLHLISCRNLLIYLEPRMQRRMLGLFHFALRPSGLMVLGPSELVGQEMDEYFKPLSTPLRIYERLKAGGYALGRLERGGDRGHTPPRYRTKHRVRRTPSGVSQAAQRMLLSVSETCGVVVDSQFRVRTIHGDASPYLRLPEGEVDLDLMQLAPVALRGKLRLLLRQLTDPETDGGEDAPARRSVSGTTRMASSGRRRSVRITIRPILDADEQGLCLVVFEPVSVRDSPGGPADGAAGNGKGLAELEQELHDTRHELSEVIEQLETSNEELRASGEEVVSVNEELQSTNEELETSKEELQSINEELSSVNAELQEKVTELTTANDDLHNLLAASDTPKVFLGERLELTRFTPTAGELLGLGEPDIGRPLSELRMLAQMVAEDGAREVLGSGSSQQVTLDGRDGRTRQVRRLPYQTSGGRVAGVIVTFNDVTDLVQWARQAELLGELGRLGATTADLQEVLDAAAYTVREALRTDYAKLLQRLPNGSFRLVAGIGWRLSVDKGPQVPADSQAGHTFDTGEPVRVANVARETRFAHSELLTSHGVVSGVSVKVERSDGPGWGVLGSHCRSEREFGDQEVLFMQSVADLVGAWIARHEAQERAKAAARRLKLANRAANVGTWSVDLRTGLDTRDASLNRMLGLAPRESTQPVDDYLQRVHPEYRNDAEAMIQRTIERGEPFDIVLRLVREDGSTIWVRDRGERIVSKAGQPIGLTGAVVDITKQFQDQAALEASDRRSREQADLVEALYRVAPVGLALIDRELKLVRVNAEMERINGRSAEQSIGRGGDEVTPDVADIIGPIIQKVFRTGEPVRDVEVTGRTAASPEQRTWWVSYAPITDDQGQVQLVQAVVRDITSIKQNQAQLARLNESLEQRVADRTATLEQAQQDLRDLSAKVADAEDQERRRIAEGLHDEVQQLLAAASMTLSSVPDGDDEMMPRARRWVQDALDATRSLIFELSPAALHSPGLDVAVQQLAERLEDQHGLKTTLEIKQTIEPLAEESRNLIYSSARELLFNVVKHGGVDQARLALVRDDGQIQLTVQDHGLGFDLGSAPSAGAGTGLGLKRLVERVEHFGGEVRFDSAPGEGVTAVVHVPAMPRPRTEAKS